MRHTLVVATQNAGKLAELRALLAALPVTVLSSDEVLTRKVTIVEDLSLIHISEPTRPY